MSCERSRAAEFDAVIAAGGIVLFGADTVYGLACDPDDEQAIARLYALKRRPPEQAAAVMFFAREAAFAALPELGPRTRSGLETLLPGGITVLLANPVRRFPLAALADPATLGLRVVDIPALRGARSAVLQSSANLHGGPPARRLADVAADIRAGVDLTVDAGELPGTASTVVDLRTYESDGRYEVLRAGAVSAESLSESLVP